jgi:hypothetical protein
MPSIPNRGDQEVGSWAFSSLDARTVEHSRVSGKQLFRPFAFPGAFRLAPAVRPLCSRQSQLRLLTAGRLYRRDGSTSMLDLTAWFLITSHPDSRLDHAHPILKIPDFMVSYLR